MPRVGREAKWFRSGHFQHFALAAAGTGEREAQFAGLVVEVAGQGEATGAAFEAFHIEKPERAFGRGARRCVVLAADKVAGGIHVPDSV